MDHLISLVAFTTFALLWAAFAAAIVLSQGSLDAVWAWIGGLHPILQIGAWILFLPVVAGLWVWETGWPFVLRLLVVGGLGVGTLFAFAPRWLAE